MNNMFIYNKTVLNSHLIPTMKKTFSFSLIDSCHLISSVLLTFWDITYINKISFIWLVESKRMVWKMLKKEKKQERKELA